MITIQKLQSLRPQTRRRKAVRLLESWIRETALPGVRYAKELLALVEEDHELSEPSRLAARAAREAIGQATRLDERVLRSLDRLRGHLLSELALEPAEWDLDLRAGVSRADARGADARSANPRAATSALESVAVYLESIRSPFNLGSIVRTAAAFGVRRVGASDDCPAFENARARRSAMGTLETMELRRAPLEEFLESCGNPPLVVLETGGIPLTGLTLPPEGVLLLGSEELGVSSEALARADLRATIPLSGGKVSLNVGVACGIALAAWSGQAAVRSSAQ